ncbi:hypothetical protein D5086_032608 [Populus alba]|uniref:Uncharacterized protein n=1 Tax=Populus alba TaxID=43335 RepID=A0ACC4ALT5_POPAL
MNCYRSVYGYVEQLADDEIHLSALAFALTLATPTMPSLFSFSMFSHLHMPQFTPHKLSIFPSFQPKESSCPVQLSSIYASFKKVSQQY